MGDRTKPGTRIQRIPFKTAGLLLFAVAIVLSVVFHIIPTLTRNQPKVKHRIVNWVKHLEVQRLIKAGKEQESIRASTGMWTVQPIGRLGNLMGQYATLYALAKLNRKQAYIQPQMHRQLSKIFKLTLPVVHEEVDARIKWTNYHLQDWMLDQYRSIPLDYVRFWGYPCSWTFYDHLRQEIHREFTFHNFLQEEANAYLAQIRGGKPAVTFVGVHIRRGDYVRVMPQIWKGVLADQAYLKKAMDYFRDKYTSPLFVVTSNDMTWSKENINHTMGDVHFAGDGVEASPGRDFALLAHCNHTIMSVGTFGFWVGYLVGGETVYLTNFTLPESEFLRVFKYEKAYLPQWIGIPADLSPLLRNETQP